jgi:protein involved in ribonucleotide reduction
MLNLIYFSNITGNTHRFITRLIDNTDEPLNITRIPIQGRPPVTDEDYILLTPSYGTERNNHVPPQVKNFLVDADTRNHCVGVIGSGSMNFGHEYAAAGHAIAQKLNKPLLHKMELSGFDHDLITVQKLLSYTPQQINTQHQKLLQALTVNA